MKTTTKRLRPPTIDELISDAPFSTLEDIVAHAFSSLEPAERLSVTEAGERHTRISAGGPHAVPWSAKKTPYLREPQDVLISLEFQGMVFVGPARTGKTMMGLNLVTHTVTNDPTDMLFVHMDRENARKWSNGDLKRYLENSTAIRSLQLTARQYDNTFDKTFKSGMRFLLTYPTASNLSGITVKIVGFIDYDRIDDNVDGEGNPFDLGQMRTTTFKRFGMTFAESSPNPNKELQDPRWIPETPHAAPPIRGIFELYNRGDRRRFHWICPHCSESFEPDFVHLRWADTDDVMEARESVYMLCPNNGCVIQPHLKDKLNASGRWVREGEMLLGDGSVVPRPGMKVRRSSIASFWLKGPAAAFQDWGNLVEKELLALKALEETGDDGPLRKTRTTDQGTYYIPQSRLSEIAPEELKAKAEDWGSTAERPTVPKGVRFLLGTVDVQKHSFVCQINGFTDDGDLVVIDAFKIRLSNRLNAAGEKLPIDPAAFAEDWDRIVEVVLRAKYPLSDNSGRYMAVRAAAVDTGGREGVTGHAYALWRRVKSAGNGDHQRIILLKGEPSKTAPRARTTWPDSSQRDKMAVARGDVPVVFLNSNSLKDMLFLLMSRRVAENQEDTGGGMLRYPNWMENWFYTQLTSEQRTEKGWEKIGRRRNEAMDLCYYALGIVLRPLEQGIPYVNFGIDRLDFTNPPSWAAPWDRNDFVFLGKDGAAQTPKPKAPTLAEIAAELA